MGKSDSYSVKVVLPAVCSTDKFAKKLFKFLPKGTVIELTEGDYVATRPDSNEAIPHREGVMAMGGCINE